MTEFRVRVEFDVEVDDPSYIDAAFEAADFLEEVAREGRLSHLVYDVQRHGTAEWKSVDLEDVRSVDATVREDVVNVHIVNGYSDGHTSEETVTVPAPPFTGTDDLSEWWEDAVFPQTGDGHGADTPGLTAIYIAIITEASDPALIGQSNVWEG